MKKLLKVVLASGLALSLNAGSCDKEKAEETAAPAEENVEIITDSVEVQPDPSVDSLNNGMDGSGEVIEESVEEITE